MVANIIMSEEGSVSSSKQPKFRACSECHKGKNKCVYPSNPPLGETRCERCIRLDKACLPHVSRQGKRKSLTSLTAAERKQLLQQQIVQDEQQQHQQQHHLSRPGSVVASSAGSSVVTNQAEIFSMLDGIGKNNENGTLSGLTNQLLLGGGNGGIGSIGIGVGNNSFNSQQQQRQLAQQIQNNASHLAKSASLLHQQQQQLQQQEHATSGLSEILSRAISDNRNHQNNVNPITALSNMGAAGATGGVSGFSGLSTNLLAGMDPNTIRQMILQLKSNNNSSSQQNGSVTGAAATMGGGGGGGSNLDLLYQAAHSGNLNQAAAFQSNEGNQYNNNSQPTTNNNGSTMFSGEKRRNSTGNIPEVLSSNNLKNPTASSGGLGGGDNNAADFSRLKKQKKYHKLAPSEYPPVSLLTSKENGTPSSSHAGDGTLSRSSSTQNFITPEDAIGSHYMNACAKHSDLTLSNLKHHYGLQCQIREWISLALARRSFALLSKASSLAHRCDMHMDRILSGVTNSEDDGTGEGNEQSSAGPRMHYLLSMLLEPRQKIAIPIEDRHMLLPHFPPAFLSVIGCSDGRFFNAAEIRNRWIIVRETRCGISRFFCSPAFERNVLCWAHVSQIYEDNLADIHSLIFVKDQFRRFLACNAYQIWSHSGEGMPPRPVHAPKTRIRLLSKRWGQAKYQDDGVTVTNPITKEMIQQVDDVMTLEMDLLFVSFPTMDKTTYYLEFFHSAKSDAPSAATIPRGLSNVSLHNESSEVFSQETQHGGSPASSSANPPTFDDIMESEEWVGIDDVMASGDINELMDALLN